MDCDLQAWNSWTDCTKSCETGSQTRTRSMSQPEFGGRACAHASEGRTCNEHSCPVPWARAAAQRAARAAHCSLHPVLAPR
jgi:hypothetical protein